MQTTEQSFSDAASDRTSSGVSWSAILAGAAAAAALSLILLVLGVGLGFSTISPWPNSGIGAAALGASSIAWLILTQIIAAGLGGYLAGRLRIKWPTVHTDEVYFRDTAHGFLAWAVAALVVAILIGTVIGKSMSTGISAGATIASTVVGMAGASGAIAADHNASMASSDADGNNADRSNDGNGGNSGAMMKYMVDSLFRSDQSAPDSTGNSDIAVRMETGRIFINSMHSSSLPSQDEQYLAQVIAKRTGLSVADADKRVSATFNIVRTSIANAEQSARQAADRVRKTAAYSALWMFVSLLSGAFIASFAATFGGRQRDRVAHVGSLA
jgi:hypothetical protein